LLLEELSYIEVLKMASGGMKAINTEAVKPAMNDNIPIEVRNTKTPNTKGTLIKSVRKMEDKKAIQCITIKEEVCVIRFGGFDDELQKFELVLMNLLEKYRFRKFFSTSDRAGTTVVISYKTNKVEKLIEELEEYGQVKFAKNCALLAIVGEEMQGRVGVLAKATQAISKTGASIYSVVQGASEIGIDFVIDQEYLNKSVKSLHKEFFGK
jgi:aspartate kinase